MKLLKLGALIVLCFSSLNAFGVDGYKSMKFGMSLDEVKKVQPCNWAKYKNDTERWQCKGFKFLNEKTRILAEFSEKKLVQIQILVPSERLNEVIENLPKKYKVSTEYVEKQEGKNKVATVKLDEDTITLQITYKGNDEYDYVPLLIYTDKNYLLKRKKDKSQEVQDQL